MNICFDLCDYLSTLNRLLIVVLYSIVMSINHIPVLASETIDFVRPSDSYLFDGTFGHAGHTILALQKATSAILDATDRDMDTAQ